MIDYPNKVKALEALIHRMQEDRRKITTMLSRKGINTKTLAAGVRRLIRRVDNAREILS